MNRRRGEFSFRWERSPKKIAKFVPFHPFCSPFIIYIPRRRIYSRRGTCVYPLKLLTFIIRFITCCLFARKLKDARVLDTLWKISASDWFFQQIHFPRYPCDPYSLFCKIFLPTTNVLFFFRRTWPANFNLCPESAFKRRVLIPTTWSKGVKKVLNERVLRNMNEREVEPTLPHLLRQSSRCTVVFQETRTSCDKET